VIKDILTKLLDSKKTAEQTPLEVSDRKIKQSIEEDSTNSPYAHIGKIVYQMAFHQSSLRVSCRTALYYYLKKR